jgi:glutamine synthetase
MGIDMIYGDHEDAPGQLELNFKPARAIDTADILTTYRQICAEVGRKHDVIPCFMPKPFLGVSANGHHHHFSMVDKEGKMLFYDPNGPAKLSEFGRYFIGGILEHANALCAITASTVNSYKRFWDAGFWAPLYKDYGWQNRTTVVRVAAPGRFEYRAVDSAVNPYLSLAGLLLAGLDGVKNKIDPGPERRENVYTIFGREKHMGESQKGADHIPLSLGEALEALKKDPVIQQAMPGRMYRVFMHYKSDEWERYLSQVTEWERATYLHVLP